MKYFFLAAVSFGVVGCSVTRHDVLVEGRSTVPTKKVALGDRDNGAYVALTQNGTIDLELEVKGSGRWRMVKAPDGNTLETKELPPRVVKGEVLVLPPIALGAEPNTAIAAQRWHFKAKKPGASVTRLVYEQANDFYGRRSGSLQDPVTYQVTVAVGYPKDKVALPRGGRLGLKVKNDPEVSDRWTVSHPYDPKVLRQTSNREDPLKKGLNPIAIGEDESEWRYKRVGAGTTELQMTRPITYKTARAQKSPKLPHSLDYSLKVETVQ